MIRVNTRYEEYSHPRPHMVFDNFLPLDVNQMMIEEANSLKLNFGKITDQKTMKKYTDNKIKKAKDLFLDDEFPNDKRDNSVILRVLDKVIFSPEMCEVYRNARYPIFNTLLKTKVDSTHLIKYSEGDFYQWHVDLPMTNLSWCTMSYMLCKIPQSFTGGEFQLQFRNETKTIPFKNNRLIIFPMQTRHRAMPVKMLTKDEDYSRYSIQIWNE